jgi:hypothetical protein
MTFPPSAFRLSRIHAEGWNAARVARTEEDSEQLNPYPAEPERGRWRAGFASAKTDPRRKIP